MTKQVRPIGAVLLLMLAVLPVAACSNNTTAPATPAPTTTDTFTGTLNTNGAATFSFAISAAGTVTATLTTIDTSASVVGMVLGSYNASTSSCTVVVSNDIAVQGSILTASSSAATTACVRIYDSMGMVTTALPFTVTVTHP